MMKSLGLAAIISVFFLLPTVIWGAKILGVFPLAARSHYILGNALMKSLAERGHDVTMISPYGEKNPSKNYRDIVLTGFLEDMEEKKKKLNFFERAGSQSIIMMFVITNLMAKLAEDTLNHPHVQKLLKSGETFDVVIVEQFFNDAHKLLAAHFEAPLIGFSSIGTNSWVGATVGNPTPPSYIPEMTLDYSPPMTFFQRLHNGWVRLFDELFFNFWIVPLQNNIAKRVFPESSDLRDVMYNASIVLLNTHTSLSQPVPLVPNLIEIGGFHIRPSAKLPADLQKFLDEAKDGVIYFSMGSNLQSTDLPQAKRDALLRVFGGLKEKVLWKWESDELPGKPANVRVGKWLPQQEILAHPNVKLFITHGGLLSSTETVHHGVPILVIPIYGDQVMNARNAARSGIGLMLEYKDLNEENLKSKIQEMLQNPKYTHNVKERSRLYHDRQVKPIDTAIYWVEYVIRHKGAPHLRVAGVDLPWYKYLLLDVVVFVAVAISVWAYLALWATRILCRKLRSICRKTEPKKVKRN